MQDDPDAETDRVDALDTAQSDLEAAIANADDTWTQSIAGEDEDFAIVCVWGQAGTRD